MTWRTRGRSAGALVVLAACALALAGCSAGDLGSSGPEGKTTLTFLVDDSPQSVEPAEQLAEDFAKQNAGITVDVETRPGGAEGDNVVKTRLSTGEMSDVFMYNSGSLFQALNPQQNLVPMSSEAWVGKTDETFLGTVRAGGEVYGAPWGAAVGGGVLYNRAIYEELGLSVPETWDEFMANNEKIKRAGEAAPVIQSYQETWTSQLFVLADFHNVATAESSFADDYTANQAKYATTPAALAGFEHLAEVNEAGFLNGDFADATFEEALRMLAEGEGAHYPMLTFAVGPMVDTVPSAKQDVGFFAQPGDDAAEHGLTAWMPAGVYIPKTTEGDKLAAAKKFIQFIASPKGCESFTKGVDPSGPYVLEGCELPADVPQAIKDVGAYFQEGDVTPALEFLSPVKGPALEHICVEVGSGIRPPKDGAALYDEDVKKQAQQLGLEGW